MCIPKGNGVGGYAGVADVSGPVVLAKDFMVEAYGGRVPLTDVASADMTHGDASDPDLAEWVVPVRWIRTLAREDATKDSDFFANQTSAVRLTPLHTSALDGGLTRQCGAGLRSAHRAEPTCATTSTIVSLCLCCSRGTVAAPQPRPLANFRAMAYPYY